MYHNRVVLVIMAVLISGILR